MKNLEQSLRSLSQEMRTSVNGMSKSVEKIQREIDEMEANQQKWANRLTSATGEVRMASVAFLHTDSLLVRIMDAADMDSPAAGRACGDAQLVGLHRGGACLPGHVHR